MCVLLFFDAEGGTPDLFLQLESAGRGDQRLLQRLG